MGKTRTRVHEVIESSPAPVRRLAGDFGNAYTKILADGSIQESWRSVQARLSDMKTMAEYPFDGVLKIGDVWYVFGEAAYKYAPRSFEDYPAINRYSSSWYKRMFAYGLHRAYGLRLGEGPFYPEICLSIPAGQYSNDAIVQRIRSSLAGPYVLQTTLATTLQVEVMPDRLRIIPEGAGSFIAAAADGSPVSKGLWYVTDVGYLTCDIVAFHDGDYVPDLAASDPAAGMWQVARDVARYVSAASGADIKPESVDPDLKCESLIINGKPFSFKEVRDRAMLALADRVIVFLQKQAAGQNLAGLLLTGGGADLLRDLIRAHNLPPVIVAPNPRHANVEGAFHLMES